MRAFLLAVILTIGLCHEADAITVIGVGAVSSCGTWETARSSGYSFGYEQWVVGFLSGVAMASGNDFLSGTDADGIWKWIDRYCAAHPLDMIATAASELLSTLRPGMFTRTTPRR
jgi:hypothetical protein